MGCISNRQKIRKNPSIVTSTKFSQLQLLLLQMMYQNLSIRCRNKILSRETFDIFFHSSGLIGQIIFLKFDPNNDGAISYKQFLQAFEMMIKGTFQQKANVLFDIYDLQKSGGVNFSELLKILFSYPIEQLNKMLLQQDFLKYIGQSQLSYYFGPAQKTIKQIKQINIIEQQSEDSQNNNKRKSDFIASSLVFNRVQINNGQKKDKNTFLQSLKIPNNNKNNSMNDRKKKITGGSSATIIQNLQNSRKNTKIKSNIASLTKKYANFLFTSYNLDKQKDQFSKQNFYKLLKQHPALFNVYQSGFHTYIWQIDNFNQQPLFTKITPYLENYANQIYQEKNNRIYMKFIKTTVFIFNNSKQKIPFQIIILEGLNVIEIQKNNNYGIIFKHRDGLYPPKQYYFQSKELQNDWLRQTAQFRQNFIFDQYTKLQRIGGGSFSNVFRGIQKKTNKQVAIKTIDLFKLSAAQRQVIKRQCGILKNCHHPNIIKFYGQFKTKASFYIITQIVTDGDLFEYTKKNGYIEQYQAAIIFSQLVDTMKYVNNELGIIHRDLKPQNVMITMNQQKKMVKKIKLIDFGFAVYKDKLAQLPLKQKYAGTPGFIAPQIYKQQIYDDKIDAFCLGVILYFMLCGYLPFQSNFLEEIEDMSKTCTYSIVNIHWSNISDQAKDLIQKILTFKDKRITTSQIGKHPWLQNIDHLKQYAGRNKKART